MTLIVVDPESSRMWADGIATDGWGSQLNVEKIAYVNDGIIGVTGDLAHITRLVQWLNSGEYDYSKWPDDATMLHLSLEGLAYKYCAEGMFQVESVTAIGNGFLQFETAYKLLNNIEKAFKFVCKNNVYVGGKIHRFKVKNREAVRINKKGKK